MLFLSLFQVKSRTVAIQLVAKRPLTRYTDSEHTKGFIKETYSRVILKSVKKDSPRVVI